MSILQKSAAIRKGGSAQGPTASQPRERGGTCKEGQLGDGHVRI